MRTSSTLALLAALLTLMPSLSLAVDPTLTEYELRMTTTTVTGGEEPVTTVADHRFTLRVFALPEDPVRVVVTVTGDLEASHNLPLGILRASGDEWIVDLEDSRGRLLSRALLPVLASGIPQARIEGLKVGEDQLSIPGLLIEGMPVHYSASKVGEDSPRVNYTVEYKAEEPFISTRGTILTRVRDFVRQYTFEGERVVAVDWFHSLQRSIGTRPTKTQTQDLEINEVMRRDLSEKELKQVRAELKILEPVARALRPGMDSTLRRTQQGRQLEKNVEDYVKKYSKGLLADSIPYIQRHFGQVIERLALPEDPEVRAKLMLGKLAPDFTLEDIKGAKITLSELRGKPVVLNFWALL